MGDEKDLLGAYFCGHPLDSMRGVIDAEKYTRIGLIDALAYRAEAASQIQKDHGTQFRHLYGSEY